MSVIEPHRYDLCLLHISSVEYFHKYNYIEIVNGRRVVKPKDGGKYPIRGDNFFDRWVPNRIEPTLAELEETKMTNDEWHNNFYIDPVAEHRVVRSITDGFNKETMGTRYKMKEKQALVFDIDC